MSKPRSLSNFGLRTLVFLLLTAPALGDEPLKRYAFSEPHMGMPFEIALYAASEDAATKAAKAAFARIKEIDERLSDYNADSELNQLCKTATKTNAVKVSDDLFTVLSHAEALSNRTRGAFDVTIGPLTRLWRKARRRMSPPRAEELQAALPLVGYEKVILDGEASTVRLLQPKMQLDLGGVAAGYAVDEALKVLEKQGITRAMIDASGDIGVSDAPPGAAGWRIGVAPLEAEGEPSRFLVLKNAAVTTSGDAFQFIEFDGVRYSHIVDAKTGLGLTTHSAVTVIAGNCTTADSYATAVCLLGPDKGMKLIRETPRTAVLIVQQADGGVEMIESEQFARYEEKKAGKR